MDLSKLKTIDVKDVTLEDVVDISDVKIDENLEKEQRVYDYIKKIHNPYCYKYGEYIVKISFANTSQTLTDKLQELVSKFLNSNSI